MIFHRRYIKALDALRSDYRVLIYSLVSGKATMCHSLFCVGLSCDASRYRVSCRELHVDLLCFVPCLAAVAVAGVACVILPYRYMATMRTYNFAAYCMSLR